MDNVLFITFDFHENNKPIKSVAVATLEAYLKMKIQDIKIDSFSFNMNNEYSIMFKQMAALNKKIEVNYDYICISMYAWNMRYIEAVIDLIYSNKSKVKIITGGYEVSFRTIQNLKKEHKRIDHFLIGYAEESLYRLITKEDTNKVLSYEVNNDAIPGIYYNETIEVDSNCVIRLETKRGCPGRCTFCAYKNNDHKKITCHDINKVKKELNYLNKIGVRKVNVLDAMFPLFSYKEILEYLVEINFKPILSLQMKFELLHNEIVRDYKLIQLLSNLNVELEFGLQSISKNVLQNVERTNDLKVIKDIIIDLNINKIKYEVSVIRGLPGETLDSFTSLIEFLKESNCYKFVVYPLTLLTNTKLHDDKEKLELVVFKQNGLEYVISTASYSYKEYLEMILIES